MRKIYSIYIIAIFLLLSLGIQAQNLTVTAATVEVETDTIEVPVFIENVNSMASLSLTLDFDNSALTFVDYNSSPAFSSSLIANVVNGKLIVAWFSLNPVTISSDTLAVLRFVKGTGCFSNMTWDLTSPGANQITNLAGSTLPATFNDGLVSILQEDYPVLVSPANAATNTFVFSTFEWISAECFANYRIQIATDTLFTNLVVDDATLTDTTYIPQTLQANTIYFWRVAKVDTRDSLSWSSIQSFSTGVLTTIQPSLATIQTYNNTVIVPVVIDSLYDATDFNLTLNYDSNAVTLSNTNITSALSGINITTTNGTVSFDWSGAVAQLVSDTLAKLTFTQVDCATPLTWNTSGISVSEFLYQNQFALPASYQDGSVTFLDSSAVTLQMPANNATQVFIQPTLIWTDVECSDNYRLQLSLVSDFSSTILDTLLTNTSITLLNLQDTTLYYWRIGRINNINDLYWSNTWNFTTEQIIQVETKVASVSTYGNLLTIPVLIENLENAAALSLVLNYDASVMNFLGYQNQDAAVANISATANGGQIQIQWQSSDSTIATAANILNDTLLELVFTRNAGCASDLTWAASSQYTHINSSINLFSNYTDGYAGFLVSDNPTTVAPTMSASTLIYPELTWTSAACANDYQLVIATDANLTNVILNTTIADTNYIPTVLQANTTYYWSAIKTDVDGNIFPSDTASFTTGDAYSSTFEIASITDNQSTMSVPITIDSLFWIENLQLEIDYDASAITFNGITNSNLTGLTASANNGVITLNWQGTDAIDIINTILVELQFTNQNACQASLAWNANNSILTFKNANINTSLNYIDGTLDFANDVPSQLLLPINNSLGTSETPTFTWEGEDCTNEYRIQIASDTFFTNILVDESGLQDTTYTVSTNLTAGQFYYWRVGRTEHLGNLIWSADTWRFKITGVGTHSITENDIDVWVFPNPFINTLNIQTHLNASDEFMDVQVFDLKGQLLHQKSIRQTGEILMPLQLKDLPKGLYLLKIQTAERVRTLKVMK